HRLGGPDHEHAEARAMRAERDEVGLRADLLHLDHEALLLFGLALVGLGFFALLGDLREDLAVVGMVALREPLARRALRAREGAPRRLAQQPIGERARELRLA